MYHRLSELERAERKLVRSRLEGMGLAELQVLAEMNGVSAIASNENKITVINKLMDKYGNWRSREGNGKAD